MKTFSEICLSILKHATITLHLYEKDYFLLIVTSHSKIVCNIIIIVYRWNYVFVVIVVLSGMYGSNTQSIANDMSTVSLNSVMTIVYIHIHVSII